MLPLSPKSHAATAFFSLRYRQTAVQSHFHSFNCCKCLKQIFARNVFQRHQTRHHGNSDTELCLAAINARIVVEILPRGCRFRIVSEQLTGVLRRQW